MLNDLRSTYGMEGAEMAYTATDYKREVLSRFTPEERLSGISAHDRLQGISADERLQGVSTHDRLQGVSADDRLQGLSTHDRLQGISPEEIDAYLEQVRANEEKASTPKPQNNDPDLPLTA